MTKIENYLLDSNTIIDYMEGKMPSQALDKVDKIVNQKTRISVITQIEILGWFGATTDQLKLIYQFVEDAIIFSFIPEIVNLTISIRQRHKIKLPDAIIAATALVYDLTLLSRNVDDFKKINGLKIINPWEL